MGLGLRFKPKGLVGPGLGFTYGRFKEEARPTDLGPPLFSTNGPGLGLDSRPTDRAWVGLGLGFLLWAFPARPQARPDPWPGLVPSHARRIKARRYPYANIWQTRTCLVHKGTHNEE